MKMLKSVTAYPVMQNGRMVIYIEAYSTSIDGIDLMVTLPVDDFVRSITEDIENPPWVPFIVSESSILPIKSDELLLRLEEDFNNHVLGAGVNPSLNWQRLSRLVM